MHVLISFVVLFPIAAWANIVNDYGDIYSDAKADKPNRLQSWSESKRILYSFFSIPLLFVVPVILKFSVMDNIWLCAICTVFMLYSLKPFRLKNSGWWGAVMDALGTQVLPAFFVISRICEVDEKTEIVIYCLVGGWLLFSGLRLHLVHQFMDLENDTRSGLKTIFTKYSSERVSEINNWVLVPLELLFLGILIVFLNMYFVSAALIVYIVLQFILKKRLGIKHVWFSVLDTERVWLTEFYNYYILLVTLIACTLKLDSSYLIPFLIFFVLFYKSFAVNAKELWHVIRWWRF